MESGREEEERKEEKERTSLRNLATPTPEGGEKVLKRFEKN